MDRAIAVNFGQIDWERKAATIEAAINPPFFLTF